MWPCWLPTSSAARALKITITPPADRHDVTRPRLGEPRCHLPLMRCRLRGGSGRADRCLDDITADAVRSRQGWFVSAVLGDGRLLPRAAKG